VLKFEEVRIKRYSPNEQNQGVDLEKKMILGERGGELHVNPPIPQHGYPRRKQHRSVEKRKEVVS